MARKGLLLILSSPSGAGKSTLLGAIAGFVPHQGAIRWQGARIDGLPPAQRPHEPVQVRRHRPVELRLPARRKSERLEIASAEVPVRNSTTKGDPYTCPELRTNPYRPGSTDAFRLPSRTSFRTPQPA